MKTVRCMNCQRVFSTNATSSHSQVRCPECGATHRLGALPTSTAGDSMLISPAALKQMLESPRGPGAARAYDRSEPVILCPSCKVRLYIDRRKYGGKRVNCPQCRELMVIPRLSQDLADAEPAEEETKGRSRRKKDETGSEN